MKKTILIFTLVIILFFTGCHPDEIQHDPNDVGVINLEPTYGGTFSFSIPSPDTLNPILISRQSEQWEVMNLIFEGLLVYDPALNPHRKLSTGWRISNDSLTWSFTLRRNVKWHDGASFTAEDVVFTYEMLRLHGIEQYNKLKDVKRFYSTDDHTFIVEWNTPQREGLALFDFPIIPKHHYSGRIKDDSFSNLVEPIGTGPYKFEQYLPKEFIRLEVNEDWWDDRPYIDKVIAKVIPDVYAAQAAFTAMEIDVVRIEPEMWNRHSALSGIETFKGFDLGYVFLSLNHLDPIFSQREIRQALIHMIDRRKIVDELLIGHGDIIDSPISFLVPESTYYKYDPELANEILMEFGWELNEEGSLQRIDLVTGRTEIMTLNIITNRENQLRIDTAQYVKDSLERHGVAVTITTVPWRNLNDNILRKRVTESLLGEWQYRPEIDLYSGFHSMGRLNFINYNNPRLNSLLQNKSWETDYKEVNNILSEDLPYLFLFRKHSLYSRRDKFGNSPINPGPSGLLWNFPKWYLVTDQPS